MDLSVIMTEAATRAHDLCAEWSWRALWACVGSICSWLLGGWGEAMTALVALYTLDFALGFGLAWRDETLSAVRFRGGLYKILLYGLVIMVANLLDLAVGDLPFLDSPVRALFILYLALGEFLSACNHISSLHPGILPSGLLIRVRNYRRGMSRGDCTEASNARV
ncbi:MAG: phage holin family protein [Desulfovibrio sp.]